MKRRRTLMAGCCGLMMPLQRTGLGVLFVVSLSLLSIQSFACTCRWNVTLEEVIESSEWIFVAEVVSKRPVREKDVLGDPDLVTLDVRLRVRETLKGKTKRTYHAVGYDWASHYDGSQVITVGGCHHEVGTGDKYLVFYGEGRSIELDRCSPFAWRLSEESEAQSVSEVKALLERSGTQ